VASRKLSAIAKQIQGALFPIKEEELDMSFLNTGCDEYIENPPELFNPQRNDSFDLAEETPYTPYDPTSDARGSPLKRNAEDIDTLTPVKRAKMVTDLEELVYKDECEGDGLKDSKIIELQMIAIASLQRENKKLRDLIHSEAQRRMRLLSEVVMAKGHLLLTHGKFLTNLAQAELDHQ
jgi:hypothetical protein